MADPCHDPPPIPWPQADFWSAVSFPRLLLLFAWPWLWAGCQLTGAPGRVAMLPNPLPVRAHNDNDLWERTIDVLHDFQFAVAREDRSARVVETTYKVGSGCLEPWHKESVGVENRLESTLQSIRRKVRVTLLPTDAAGGYVVSVEAIKEREDLPGLAANSPGAATFQESTPLERDLNPVVGQSTASSWMPMGRDLDLEQAIVAKLQRAYGG